MLPLLAAGISVSLPSLAVAQQAKNPEAQPLSTQDAKLLQEIRRSDMTMIAAAKIALSRAKLEAVKKYAQPMEDTHSKLLEDGNKVAKLKLGQVPPAHGDANHGRALQTLKDASDDRFGRVYAEWAIGAEGQALDVARRVTSDANDPNLKALGANAAAHIEKLLKTARELAQSLTSNLNQPLGRNNRTAPQLRCGCPPRLARRRPATRDVGRQHRRRGLRRCRSLAYYEGPAAVRCQFDVYEEGYDERATTFIGPDGAATARRGVRGQRFRYRP